MSSCEIEYKKFLEGKTVALAGPAKSIEGSCNGRKIDNSDVVIRLNYAKIKDCKDSGTRTNVIYYDGSYHKWSDKISDLDYLVCSYPKTEWFFESRCRLNVERYEQSCRHKVVSPELYSELKIKLDPSQKVRPNTGLISIVDVLSCDIESLFITGVDFYRTGYLSTHPDYGKKSLQTIKEEFSKGDNGDYHDIELQYQYFLEKVLPDKRVIIDEYLESVVKGEKL